MLVKLIGCLIVIMTTSYLGYFLSRTYSIRPGELRELQGMLQMLENEITYLSNLLSDAMDKIAGTSKSQVGRLFYETSNILKSSNCKNASDAWSIALHKITPLTSLTGEDAEVLDSFGKLLGKTDIEGQIKNIRLTINQLEMQEKKAEEARRKNESMSRNLGVLAGLAIVVVLF